MIDSYLKDKVHLQQLKGMHSSKQGMRKGYHLSIKGIQKGCIFIKKKKKTRYKSAVGKGKQKGETVNFHIGTALQNKKIIQL